MNQLLLLEAHKMVRLKQGYRWRRGVLSVIYGHTVYLYSILSKSHVKFLDLNTVARRPIIQDDAAIKKLKTLSLITGLSKEEDDAMYFSELRTLQQQSFVTNYTIAPTLDCNCHCSYCFVKKGAISMSITDADILAKQIILQYRISNKPVRITWYGGEPLLAIQTIHKISRILSDNEVSFSSDIITNGLLINDKNVKLLVESRVVEAQITIDGPPSYHNKIRNVSINPYDTYSASIAAASLLIAEGIKLKIRINCSSENIADIHKLAVCPRLSSLDKSKFTIYFENLDADPQVYASLESLRGLFTMSGYSVFDSLPQKRLYFHSCSALRDSDYCIGPKLELYDCYSDLGNRNRITGTLKQGPREKTVYVSHKLLPDTCAECAVLPFCYARGCPYKLAHKNFLHNDRFCLEFKKRTHTILQKQLAEKYGH